MNIGQQQASFKRRGSRRGEYRAVAGLRWAAGNGGGGGQHQVAAASYRRWGWRRGEHRAMGGPAVRGGRGGLAGFDIGLWQACDIY